MVFISNLNLVNNNLKVIHPNFKCCSCGNSHILYEYIVNLTFGLENKLLINKSIVPNFQLQLVFVYFTFYNLISMYYLSI